MFFSSPGGGNLLLRIARHSFQELGVSVVEKKKRKSENLKCILNGEEIRHYWQQRRKNIFFMQKREISTAEERPTRKIVFPNTNDGYGIKEASG